MYWSEKKLDKFNGVIYGFILDNYGGNNISPNDYDLLEDMAGIYIFTGNVIDYENDVGLSKFGTDFIFNTYNLLPGKISPSLKKALDNKYKGGVFIYLAPYASKNDLISAIDKEWDAIKYSLRGNKKKGQRN